MSIDLERSLDELAQSVHDDALAERLNGQVYRMVAQIKRRRAARYTGTSVIGMSAAAAVVMGGVQLADGETGRVAPATDGPAGIDGAWPGCGEPAPTPTPEPTVGMVSAEGAVAEQVVPYGGTVELNLDVVDGRAGGDDPVSGPAGTIEVVVAQDGVVVGTGQVPPYEDTLMPPDGGTGLGFAIELDACAGDTPLEGGDYAMFARVTLAPDGREPVSVTTGPISFAIAPSTLDAEAEGQAAVNEIITAGERADEFGICGSVAPPEADAPVTLTVAFEDRPYAAGEVLTAEVRVQADDKLPDDAQLTANNPVVVLTRDGVVVGRTGSGTEAGLKTVPIELAADGTGTLSVPAAVVLCSLPGADAPEVPLPPGVYQAYATFTLTVGGAAIDVAWEPEVVRSAPVDITIG